MVEWNKLVFKRQLLNQLSCLGQTETGMLGHLVNEGVEGTGREGEAQDAAANGAKFKMKCEDRRIKRNKCWQFNKK